jgi:hypothetical protein
VKFIWKGKWKNGEVVIEADNFQELLRALEDLSLESEFQKISKKDDENLPEISSVHGCTEAIRALMNSNWGRQSRSMNDIKRALESNALHFSKGTLSGTLTELTKKGDLRRIRKNSRWRYESTESIK